MLAGLHTTRQGQFVFDQLPAAAHPATRVTIAAIATDLDVWLLLVAFLLVSQLLQQAQSAGASAQHAAAHAAAVKQRRQEQLGSQPRHAYVAACALAKDEHLNIREWIQYHQWIGIQKFYIFDHQSKPPLADMLQDHVASGLVELVYFSNSWEADAALFKDMYKAGRTTTASGGFPTATNSSPSSTQMSTSSFARAEVSAAAPPAAAAATAVTSRRRRRQRGGPGSQPS